MCSKAIKPALASTSSSMSSSSSCALPSKKRTTTRWNATTYFSFIAITSGILLSVFLAIESSGKRGIDKLFSVVGAHASTACSLNTTDDACLHEREEHDASSLPHRGKVIGRKVTAADLAAAYQSIKSEYARLALHPSSRNSWQILNAHSDGSEVSLLNHATDPHCPYVRMTSIMPGTVQDVWDFLSLENWAETMPKMDPFYEGLDVLGDYRHKGIEMKLARKTLKRIVTFGKRDFTFVSVSDHPRAEDGAWVSGTVSVVTDQIPRKEGYVRAFQDSVAFYEPEEVCEVTGQPRTKLTIVFRIDLNDSREGGGGGYVPMWMYVKTVGTTGMLSVQNMKKQLQMVVEERPTEESKKKGNMIGKQMASCSKNWFSKIIRKNVRC